jgi:hypothetical protein
LVGINYLEANPAIHCNLFFFKKKRKGFPLLSGLKHNARK